MPLTALMVVYTFIGLSITAEPIVESREPARPSARERSVAIPADAVLPEGANGRLLPLGPDKTARAKLTYKVLGSAFHDGTKTSARTSSTPMPSPTAGACAAGRSGHYDPYIDAATVSLRRHLLGVRVAGVELPPSRSASVTSISCARSSLSRSMRHRSGGARMERRHGAAVEHAALDVLVLMEEAVGRGWAAFSRPRRRAAASNGSISSAPKR